jgi:hypothetical protein
MSEPRVGLPRKNSEVTLPRKNSEVTLRPLYPEITVQLTNEDGNAFAIVGRVIRQLRRNNVPLAEIEAFRKECMVGDYDHLLQTCMKWVNCE